MTLGGCLVCSLPTKSRANFHEVSGFLSSPIFECLQGWRFLGFSSGCWLVPLWKLFSLPKIQSPLFQQLKHAVFQQPWHRFVNITQQIYVESVYLFYASKSFDIKGMWTSTISTQTSIVTAQSTKKWSLWHFENDTKPIKVYLQTAVRPIANSLHFFRFLKKKKMNSALQLTWLQQRNIHLVIWHLW